MEKTFLYHPTEAPTGHPFTDSTAYDAALEGGWVDTPAKFPDPVPLDDEEPPIHPLRRQRQAGA